MTLFDPIYEILAKEVIYGFDKPDTTALVNGFLASVGYQIDQSFNDPTTGFQALGLVSLTPEKPAVLIIRGADELTDNAANADPRGIGFNQFAANREAIAAWLAKFSTTKADVIGHSLGAAVAQTFAAELPTQVGNVATFNAPGVSNATVAKYQQSGVSKNITHYIVNGDLVSLGGENYLPGSVTLQNYTDGGTIDPIFSLDKHIQFVGGQRLLTTPPPGYSQRSITVAELSDKSFNFNSETDFQEFIAAYQITPNNVAPGLANRGDVEALRVSPGFSFTTLIFGARAAVALSQDNQLVGDDRDNIANGKAGKDRILGNGGKDQLQGGEGNDKIFGGQGDDSLSGNGGKDQLTGDEGNDALVGGGGSDRLIGVNDRTTNPGQAERDRLKGGGDSDRFILGDATQVYYDDGRKSDYALIEDFKGVDKIQLSGAADDYRLQTVRLGTGIFLTSGARPELIGIVQTRVALNLESDRFVFV